MKYTKKQRHDVYVKALEIYKEYVEKGNYTGLCYTISDACLVLSIDVEDCSFIYNTFPEFIAKKPISDRAFWWALSDTETRIKVLEKCIKETK